MDDLECSAMYAYLHSLLQIILLHLAPGAVITLVFVVLARVMSAHDLPASLALLVTWVIAGLPLLLGILFYQGYRLDGKLSLQGNRYLSAILKEARTVPTLREE